MDKEYYPIDETYPLELIYKETARRASVAMGYKVSIPLAKKVIHEFRNEVLETVSKGYRVRINGFISFTPRYKRSRRANNVVKGRVDNVSDRVSITVSGGKTVSDIAFGYPKGYIDAMREAYNKRKV